MSSVEPPPNGGGGSDATLGVSALVIVLALISAVLRFYTRIFTRVGLWWDDWLILAAVVLTLITAAITLWGNSVDPNGQWVADNTDPSYVYTDKDMFYLKLSFITSVLYFSIAGATKQAILMMYHRIFCTSPSFRYQLLGASALVISFWIGCTVATLTNCIPLKWSWINGLADPRYCFDYNIFWMAAGSCEIALDVIILALPVRAVLQLQLSTQKKITITGIFLLGGFVVITGLVKTVLGYPPHSRVPSYSKTEVWTTVHTGMSIVCANLPILRPLLRRVTGSSWFSKISRARDSWRSSSRGQLPISSPRIEKPSPTATTDSDGKATTIVVSEDSQIEDERSPAPQMLVPSPGLGNWIEYRPISNVAIAEDIAHILSHGYGMDIELQRRRSQLNSFVFGPALETAPPDDHISSSQEQRYI